MSNNTQLQYLSHKKKRTYLANLFKDAFELSSQLELNKLCVRLKSLGKKIYTDSFKIQIVGTFKNGKSTFINSFLGESVLPAYALPCTAVINEVKYGTEKKAVLYFKNPLPDKLPAEISPRAREHIKKYFPGPVAPMEISYEEIEDYVVIPIGKDPREMLLESPYEKIELFWPLDILKHGVEIIDSPGLNEHATRTKVTIDYLSKADAIIFVLSATSLCSLEEMKFIENTLYAQGFNDIFFVVNRFDLIGENERQNVIDYAKSKLSRFTSFGEEGICFVSAKMGLEAKINRDTQMLHMSQIQQFEEHLSTFLTTQKGNAKLSQPTYELKRIISSEITEKAIPIRRKLISSSVESLKGSYNSIKVRFDQLKLQKEKTLKKSELQIERSQLEFERMSYNLILGFSDSVRDWVSEFTPQTKIGAVVRKEKVKRLVAEIIDNISENITSEQNKWKKNTLVPLIEEKAKEIFSGLESELKMLYTELDDEQLKLGAVTGAKSDKSSVWDRVASMADSAGIAVNSNSIITEADGVCNEIAKKIGFNVGAKSLLVAFSFLNPVTFCALLFGSLAFGLLKKDSNTINKVKDKVCDEAVTSLRNSAEETSKLMSKEIAESLKKIVNSLFSALDAEISQTENQIRSIISEMEKGRLADATKQKLIDEYISKCKLITDRADALIKTFKH